MSVSLSVSAIDGNNFINAANAAAGITIAGSGTDSVLANLVGRTVTVTLNGKTYTGVVQSGGLWSVSVGAADLASLTNGRTYTATASVTDAAGSSATATGNVTVDKTASLSIRPIDSNGYVNGQNAAAGIVISGTSTGGVGSGDFAGQTVSVTLNGKTYTAAVGSGGAWSVAVSAADLAALTDGQSYVVAASATDKAGNAATTTASLTVDERASLSIKPVDGNNFINAANAAAGITIAGSGTDSVLANLVGRTVTVTLNGKTYTGVVQSGGLWSVSVGAADLASLTNGRTYTATASVLDAAGNRAIVNNNLTVDTTASLSIKPIDGNGYVNGQNAAAGIVISGTSTGGVGSGDFAGQTVSVTLNGKTYTAAVGSGGAWSVTVSAADLAALTDGQSYVVAASATDKAGNATTTTASLTVDEKASLSIKPVDGNNIINAANAAAGITIAGSGTDSVLANLAGQTVTVTLNGKTYTGVVQSGGVWSVSVGAADLGSPTNGKTYTATASVTDSAGNKATAADNVTAEIVAGSPSAATSTIAASWGTVTADGVQTTTLMVTVEDAFGNPVAGQNVTLSASGSGNTFTPISGTSDANGMFTATLASTLAQTETVTASEGGVRETTSVTFTAPASTVIETSGSTTLVQQGGNYFLEPNGGSAIELSYGGSPVVDGEFDQYGGHWVPIAAEQTATGYEVAWEIKGADQYTVWYTDASGNYLSSPFDTASGSSATLESFEPSFQQDLNGDGVIGVNSSTPPSTVIETSGSTTLVQQGSNYFLEPNGGSAVELNYGGSPVVDGEFDQNGGHWVPIAAEQTATGYEVAWEIKGADQYTVWYTDAGGNYLSSPFDTASGSSATLELFEPSFQQDLNGDGVIGVNTSGSGNQPQFVYQGVDSTGAQVYDVNWAIQGSHPFAVRVLAAHSSILAILAQLPV